MRPLNKPHSDLIKTYLIDSYQFSTDKSDWVVIDKFNLCSYYIQDLIKIINKVFPNMNSSEVVSFWWAENVAMNNSRILNFLSNYRLVQTTNGMIWGVVSRSGKEFKISDLMAILPSHFKETAIIKIYDDWFEEQKIEETKKLIYGKKR